MSTELSNKRWKSPNFLKSSIIYVWHHKYTSVAHQYTAFIDNFEQVFACWVNSWFTNTFTKSSIIVTPESIDLKFKPLLPSKLLLLNFLFENGFHCEQSSSPIKDNFSSRLPGWRKEIPWEEVQEEIRFLFIKLETSPLVFLKKFIYLLPCFSKLSCIYRTCIFHNKYGDGYCVFSYNHCSPSVR